MGEEGYGGCNTQREGSRNGFWESGQLGNGRFGGKGDAVTYPM